MINKSLLAEIALAGREHLDPVYVAAYDRKANLDPTEDLDRLRARGLDETSTLIDVGAGTGTFAIAAASICERVGAIASAAAPSAASISWMSRRCFRETTSTCPRVAGDLSRKPRTRSS